MDSAFGSYASSFTSFPQIDPNNPMNAYYAEQAVSHARRNPQDAHAQLLAAHWLNAMNAIHAQRQMQQAAQLQPASGFGLPAAPTAGTALGQQAQSVPSFLPTVTHTTAQFGGPSGPSAPTDVRGASNH